MVQLRRRISHWGGGKSREALAQADVARAYVPAWQLAYISQRSDGHHFGTNTILFGHRLVLFLSVDRFARRRDGGTRLL